MEFMLVLVQILLLVAFHTCRTLSQLQSTLSNDTEITVSKVAERLVLESTDDGKPEKVGRILKLRPYKLDDIWAKGQPQNEGNDIPIAIIVASSNLNKNKNLKQVKKPLIKNAENIKNNANISTETDIKHIMKKLINEPILKTQVIDKNTNISHPNTIIKEDKIKDVKDVNDINKHIKSNITNTDSTSNIDNMVIKPGTNLTKNITDKDKHTKAKDIIRYNNGINKKDFKDINYLKSTVVTTDSGVEKDMRKFDRENVEKIKKNFNETKYSDDIYKTNQWDTGNPVDNYGRDLDFNVSTFDSDYSNEIDSDISSELESKSVFDLRKAITEKTQESDARNKTHCLRNNKAIHKSYNISFIFNK